MAAPSPGRLSQQIGRLRWQIPLLVLAIVLLQESLEHFGEYLRYSSLAEMNIAIEVSLYGLVGPLSIWLALGWVKRKVELKEAAEDELAQTHADLERLNRRVSFLLRVNQRLSGASDEAGLTNLALQLPSEIMPQLVGCALIRFDDHHQPMPVEHLGQLDETALAVWHKHLSSQAVRKGCQTCQRRGALTGENCPLLNHLPIAGVGQVVCRPLGRNGREYGILGLFLPANHAALTDEENELFAALFAELTVAIENTRLRTQELSTLYEVNETLRQNMGFEGLMTRILTQAVEASRADAGLLVLRNPDGTITPAASAGDWDGVGRLPLIESLAAGALREGRSEPVILSLQSPELATVSVLCASLMTDEGALGALILGSRHPEAFLRQRLRLTTVIAGLVALLTQNARLYAQLEHQAILNERGRLAREIHDGLAQTLGYLKMRAGQIARWVETGQTQPAAEALRELAQTANSAYLDLRAALDGLRVPLADDATFVDRLRRCARDFENQSSLPVLVHVEASPALSIAAQAHLLRLVQETLANIRKHSGATHVHLTLAQTEQQLRLTVQDDGRGFDVGQPISDTSHGLRLMRERADLLGADLQVTSAPNQGTQVSVNLPMRNAPVSAALEWFD